MFYNFEARLKKNKTIYTKYLIVKALSNLQTIVL
jgi:hypothetical protein